MDNQMIIDAFADSGFTESGIAEQEVSRRDAVRSSGLLGLGLAAAAIPAVFTAFARTAGAQGRLPNRIVNALNIAYILENLEADFYRIGVGTSGLIPAEDRVAFEQISKHETAHVALLASVLGPKAARLPRFDFTAGGAFPAFTDYPTFMLLAQGFEDFGVRAYKGQAGNLASNDMILTVALQIHSVEARHASQIRRMRGQKGWITGDGVGPEMDFPWAPIYGGEENTMQLGIDTAKYEGVDAATEAFDEPVTDLRRVLAVVGTFVDRS